MAQQFNHKWSDDEWIDHLKEENPEAVEALLGYLEKWGDVAARIPHNSLKWEFVVYDSAVEALWKIINRLKRRSDDINNLAAYCRRAIVNEIVERLSWWNKRYPPTLGELSEDN